MSLPLALQIAIAAMGSLSATLLGMGERQALLPVAAVVVAVSAVYFNDIRGWVRLSDNRANLACLVAGALALWDLSRLGRDSQLLAAANLLVYLQFILQFQQKSVRRYWLLALLSLMQVAVAAALGLELSFGLLMLMYLAVAVATLTLFCAYREIAWYSRTDAGSGRSPVALPSTALSSSVVETDGLGRHFARLVLGMTASTVAVAMLLFFLVPRLEQESWTRRGVRGSAVTGIPDSVSLSDVGTIYESTEHVMRVQFYGPNNQIYELREPPLFRGFHLVEYRDNRWRPLGERYVQPVDQEDRLFTGMVRQEIDALPSETDVLFHIEGPGTRIQSRGLLWDIGRDRLLRGPGFRSNQSKYLLANYAFDGGLQTRFTEATYNDESNYYSYLNKPGSVSRLMSLSRELVSGVDPNDKMAQIKRLTDYLTDPRRYSYTLRPKRGNLELDAVEDFVLNTRQGHCEYFASALTLMLRGNNIPARLVIGYKGGEYNKLGSFYQVRQLHAHAWVEAYFNPREITRHLRTTHGDWQNGGWYTIDPTPGGSVEGLEATTKVRFLGARQVVDYARFLWSSYVMGMDAQRQQQSIYSLPVTAAKKLADADNWRTAREWLALLFVPGHDSAGPGWVYLRIFLIALIAAGVLYAVGRWVRRRWNALRKRFSRPARRPEPPPRLETLLFRRLERALAQHDFHRPEGQTPREFALAAGSLLAGSRTMQHVAPLPVSVVETFYRLRFAGRGLDKRELETLEQSLAQLELALAPSDSSQAPHKRP